MEKVAHGDVQQVVSSVQIWGKHGDWQDSIVEVATEATVAENSQERHLDWQDKAAKQDWYFAMAVLGN